MKYMVISDIHGGIDSLNTVLDIFYKENCSKLLVLGDLFNYGIDYYRSDIIDRLNVIKNSIIAVCGNCDDDTVGIEFYMPNINSVILNNKDIVLTHGHMFSYEYLSKINADIVFIGHSHISNVEIVNGKLFVNPGSITKARRGENSFAIVDEKTITIRNLDNQIIKEYII